MERPRRRFSARNAVADDLLAWLGEVRSVSRPQLSGVRYRDDV